MSTTLMVKQSASPTESVGYFSVDLQRHTSNMNEISTILNVARESVGKSEVGKIIRIDSESSRIKKLVHEGKEIPVVYERGLIYMERIGNTVIWSENTIFKRSGFLGIPKSGVVFEFQNKSQFDFAKMEGASVVTYKGLINGEESFIADKQGHLTKADSGIISIKRV